MKEAVVLAGGFGTRLRAVVSEVPKPMAPIRGRPFLDILLERLGASGLKRVVLSVGYKSEVIIQHFGASRFGLEVDYEVESTPLGTGGALQAALRRCTDSHVLCLNGDTFLDFDISAAEAQWRREHLPLIVARRVDDTERYGRLEVQDGQVTGFTEKGIWGPGLINAGAYVLPRDLLEQTPISLPFSFENDFLRKEFGRRGFGVFVAEGEFIDIGVPEDFLLAQARLGSHA